MSMVRMASAWPETLPKSMRVALIPGNMHIR
jgi:hypothetical protein